MPIGVGTAALIGGGLAAAGTVASGVLSSSAQKSAANQAAATSASTTAANDALFRDIYGQNKAGLDPYSANGLAASNELNALLLGTPSGGGAQTAPVVSETPVGGGALSTYSGPSLQQIQAMQHDGTPGNYRAALAAYNTAQANGALTGPQTPVAAAPAPAGPVTTPASALNAFDQFRQGDNYQWRFNQGESAVTGQYATRGALDSGAAEKAKITFGQNFASNELSNYMNLLAGQQAMGLSAASAVAGVGQNYAGNVAAQNTNNANNAANAALASGNANASMFGSIGSGIGQLGGALFQYGMGQPSGGGFNFGAAYNSAPAMGVNLPQAQPIPYMPGVF